MVDHVYSVSASGVKIGLGAKKALDRIKRMGDEGGESSIPLQKRKNETWSDYYTRTCRIARNFG